MTRVEIEKVRIDGGTQPRVELNQDVVSEYAEMIRSGVGMPPVDVFHDGANYWLADGFHRFFAYRHADEMDIPATVHDGTVRDAILFSVGANAGHGLRRTNADKRKAVETLLKDDEWAKWSDREIARACGVGAPLVADVRRSICNPITDSEPRTVTRNGTTYQQNTANIGRKAEPPADTGPADPSAGPTEPDDDDYGPMPGPVAAQRTPAPPAAPEDADAMTAKLAALTEERDEMAERLEEMGSQLRTLLEDNESMSRVFEANDQVAAALAEAKRYREQNRILEERIRGLMNEKNEAIRHAKGWRRRFEGTQRKPTGLRLGLLDGGRHV
jgi:hypothetical protein